MPGPSITTVILNWNGLADTRECLQSLRSIGYPGNLDPRGGPAASGRGVGRRVARANMDVGQYDGGARRDYADGMCMLIPTSAIRKVGLLDEEYFAYWEETDWCLRARDAGLRC